MVTHPWLSWIEHQTTNLGVGRSNRSGCAILIRRAAANRPRLFLFGADRERVGRGASGKLPSNDSERFVKRRTIRLLVFVASVEVAAAATTTGCKQRAATSEVRGADTAKGADLPKTCVAADVAVTSESLEFQLDRDAQCPEPGAVTEIQEPQGRLLIDGIPVCEQGLSLDQREQQAGGKWYTVFTWPKDSEKVPTTPQARQARVLELMRQYASLVGTCYPTDRGPGEADWAGSKRRADFEAIYGAARLGGPEQVCRVVRRRLVETFVKPGSDYIQFGNGGEGAYVGACFAQRFGYATEDIQICESGTQHVFALFKDLAKADGKWCLLDRQMAYQASDVACDVDVENGTLTKKTAAGWKLSDDLWHTSLTCQTFAAYLKRGD
jgi:hypothetical protein